MIFSRSPSIKLLFQNEQMDLWFYHLLKTLKLKFMKGVKSDEY